MEEIISQEEINELLITIQQKQVITSIIELKPSELENIKDEKIRELEKNRFRYINEIYIEPLKRVFDSLILNIKYSINYDISNLSIIERMRFFEQLLYRSGYTQKQITELIPKTKEEVDLILKAKENGFIDTNVFKNSTRIKACHSYLKHNDKLSKKIGKE